ncbi:alkaline phosphatase family protein [Halorubrum salsamenti]|uniref:hypothetical protein n=1 Tax=Halorubrum salsamenti TaxID=2583990 RepID=UPI0011A2152B|nr:hypothetical protein [Halorubrum salsamenti]
MNKATRFFNVARTDGFISALEKSKNYTTQSFKDTLLLAPNRSIKIGVYNRLYRPFLERDIGAGVDIMSQDYDNLILLDAYRADTFKKHSRFEGQLSTNTSYGNWSLEFVVKNFQGREFHDTVCVTANPYYQERFNLGSSTFHKLIDTGATDPRESLEKTTTAAIRAMKNHPNKRLLIHYMQPHGPHIGERADEIRTDHPEYRRMFSLYRDGLVSNETLWKTYIDTIEIVESQVDDLLDELNGKTVISSDHGENMGEIQHGIEMVEHGLETPECRLVPWLELPYEDRREIIAEPPVEVDPIDEKEIEERLSDLGYV